MHVENHYINRVGWLRAAVLGTNDGILSITSLVIGVAAAMCVSAGIGYLFGVNAG